MDSENVMHISCTNKPLKYMRILSSHLLRDYVTGIGNCVIIASHYHYGSEEGGGVFAWE